MTSDTVTRHRSRRRAVAGAVALGLAWVLAAPAASAPAAPGAAALTRAAPRQPRLAAWLGPDAAVTNSALQAVACTGPRSCVAVGQHLTGGTTAVTLAEAWDGTKWRIQPTPNPPGGVDSALDGVSCSGPGACTAVGYSVSNAGTSLPLAERWNGKTWAIQPIPTPAGATGTQLAAVACPAAKACVATGGYRSAGQARDLAERWNGSSWDIQAVPTPAGGGFKGLWGVSCTSSRACTAVGAQTLAGGAAGTLAERWNGTRWAIQPTPNPPALYGYLAGVSCASAAACTATGYSLNPVTLIISPLAERWNGNGWVIKATPTPAGFASFAPLPAVSCTAANLCTAAGSWDNTAGNEFTLAQRWNGARWMIQLTPNPPGHPVASALEGIACTAADACTAVGTYTTTENAPGRTLAERWNGTRWMIQPTPSP
jgi:hypothetical protein